MSDGTEFENDGTVAFAIVTGTGERAGIGRGRRFDVTERGLVFHGEMTFEQFAGAVAGLRVAKRSYELCLASAVRYGKEHYGIEKVEELFRQLEFDYQEATHALGAGQLSFDFMPREKLSAEHLWVLARNFSEKPDLQTKWAALAEKHNLSALALQRSIEAGQVIKDEQLQQRGGSGSGGLSFLHHLSAECEQWERRLGGREKILELEPELRREWLDKDGAYIEGLIKDVRSSLGAEA